MTIFITNGSLCIGCTRQQTTYLEAVKLLFFNSFPTSLLVSPRSLTYVTYTPLTSSTIYLHRMFCWQQIRAGESDTPPARSSRPYRIIFFPAALSNSLRKLSENKKHTNTAQTRLPCLWLSHIPLHLTQPYARCAIYHVSLPAHAQTKTRFWLSTRKPNPHCCTTFG